MSDKAPYIGFSNETLSRQARVAEGDPIACKRCGGTHNLVRAAQSDGTPSMLMFYRCGRSSFIGALDGRLVAGLMPDVSGRLGAEDRP